MTGGAVGSLVSQVFMLTAKAVHSASSWCGRWHRLHISIQASPVESIRLLKILAFLLFDVCTNPDESAASYNILLVLFNLRANRQ
jgi:hypothetical protein